MKRKPVQLDPATHELVAEFAADGETLGQAVRRAVTIAKRDPAFRAEA